MHEEEEEYREPIGSIREKGEEQPRISSTTFLLSRERWYHGDEEGEEGRRHVVSFPRGLSVFPDRGDNHKVVVVVVVVVVP